MNFGKRSGYTFNIKALCVHAHRYDMFHSFVILVLLGVLLPPTHAKRFNVCFHGWGWNKKESPREAQIITDKGFRTK